MKHVEEKKFMFTVNSHQFKNTRVFIKCGICRNKFSKKRGVLRALEVHGKSICNNCAPEAIRKIEQIVWLGNSGIKY